MSVQKAKDFLVQIATDEAAAAKARAAHEASLLAVAKELGYSFEAADLRQAMSDIEELDDLSDEAMEGVSGGLLSLSYFNRSSFLFSSRLRFRGDSGF